MTLAPLLEVVVTARPSWARVRELVSAYSRINGPSRVRVSLLGPAVSKRYGDLTKLIPEGLEFSHLAALNDSDSLGGVALSCINGASALVNKWNQDRPDCVLVVADRTETLGVSMSAAIMQIPLIHLQGGEISGSIDDKIRDTNSKLADLHLTTNELTKLNLISMGESDANIHVVGCPSIDLVRLMLIEQAELLSEKAADLGGVGSNFSLNSDFGIIMFHPDTLNMQENVSWINHLIELASTLPFNWLWFWPNPDHGSGEVSHLIRKARELGKLQNTRFVINLEPEVFINLATHAKLIIGNSSFGIRESSFIGLPSINLGKRQLGRQKGSNVLDLPQFCDLAKLLAEVTSHVAKGLHPSQYIYGDGFAGLRAAKIISSWEPRIKRR
jgi:UDP-hydrolysing UDP-N-acetyl-D-glucosamine 2-epimerase